MTLEIITAICMAFPMNTLQLVAGCNNLLDPGNEFRRVWSRRDGESFVLCLRNDSKEWGTWQQVESNNRIKIFLSPNLHECNGPVS